MLQQPHFYCWTQLAINPKSASTPVRFITNASCQMGRGEINLNEAQIKPPNLNNRLISALTSFCLFEVPYSSDIQHEFRTIRIHPDHYPYQLLISFDYTKENCEDYPCTIVQKSLLYGGVQSQLILELAIRYIIAPNVTNVLIKEIILFRRVVDNCTTSFREGKVMKVVSRGERAE